MADIIIFISTAFATLALAVFGVMYASHKVPSIWIMFSCIVLYALAACLYWQQKIVPVNDVNPQGIRMAVLGSILTPKGKVSPIFVRYEGRHGDTLRNVDLALGAAITNVRSVPLSIASLSVQLRARRGDWVKLESIPLIGQRTYWVYDTFKVARPIDFESMEAALSNKLLEPNVPARGWLFFNWPEDVPLSSDIEWKFTAIDSAGNEYFGEILNNKKGSMTSVRDLKPNAPSMFFREETLDLSSLPIEAPY